MSDLDRAIAIAVDAHEGQFDKAGEPYILHPLRVMFAVPQGDAQIVAVLHDALEDSPDWVLGNFDSFGPTVVKAIDALTRREGEPYFDYIQRVKRNHLASIVKRADLNDNLSPGRRGVLSESMIERYEIALAHVGQA